MRQVKLLQMQMQDGRAVGSTTPAVDSRLGFLLRKSVLSAYCRPDRSNLSFVVALVHPLSSRRGDRGRNDEENGFPVPSAGMKISMGLSILALASR